MLLSEKWWRGFFVVLLTATLSACGGGGSSSDGDGGSSGGGGGGGSSGDDDPVSGDQRPASPEVSLTIEAVKTLRFDWADVADATAYKLLENPDGMSGFTPVVEAIEPGAATLELTVPLYARVNAQYILQACNAAGCSDSDTLSVSGNLVSGIGYFKASNTGEYDLFGSAVSLSADGGTLAVGAFGERSAESGNQGNNSAIYAGAVYVFAREADGWLQQAYLKAGNAAAGDQFGWVVSLSADGDTLAVGARYKDSDAIVNNNALGGDVGAEGEGGVATGVNGDRSDNKAEFAGAVYVFTREAGTWTQQAYLKASNTGAGDYFGSAISLSADGDTLAIGAVGEDGGATGVNGEEGDDSADDAGAVYVFTREADTWSQQAYLKASNAGASDVFGGAVSLSADGDTLAVGAVGESSSAEGVNGHQDNDLKVFAGAVYVFAREADVWEQQAYLKASNTDDDDNFGRAVALSTDGDTLAVGAPGEDDAALVINGLENNNTAESAGAVYVFARKAGGWGRQAYLKASNAGILHYFGAAVSLSADGETLAVGAYGEESAAKGVNGDQGDNLAEFAGAVYVFVREADIWEQQSYLKASNTEAGDLFGASLSLSADGQALAVGARFEDSAAKGMSGEQSDNSRVSAGAVYLY